jgi:thioredoxin reductase
MWRSDVAGHDDVRDVVIVGGGAAGLSAALTLARARRRVTVVDAGEPRNAPVDGVHGLLALDGLSPAELLARGRKEVLGYGGEIVEGEVVEVSGALDGFTLVLRDGGRLWARRLLIATGLIDELPDIPGVRGQWGHGVLHCPYCHGWEVRDRWVGVLSTGPMSVHQALMFRQWTPRVGFFADDHDLVPEDRARLEALDIAIVAGRIERLEVDHDHVTGVRLADGELLEVDVAAVSPRMVARAEVFAGIGVEPTEHPVGSFIETDATGRTSVPGVWAAGNASDLSAQVSSAAAEGARAAQHINADLVMADADKAVAAREREGASR